MKYPRPHIKLDTSHNPTCVASRCLNIGSHALFYVSDYKQKVYCYIYCQSCFDDKYEYVRPWARSNYFESLAEARAELIARKLS